MHISLADNIDNKKINYIFLVISRFLDSRKFKKKNMIFFKGLFSWHANK